MKNFLKVAGIILFTGVFCFGVSYASGPSRSSLKPVHNSKVSDKNFENKKAHELRRIDSLISHFERSNSVSPKSLSPNNSKHTEHVTTSTLSADLQKQISDLRAKIAGDTTDADLKADMKALSDLISQSK